MIQWETECGGYRWVMTCAACPEQYDVYSGESLVAYVRFRYGQLAMWSVNDDTDTRHLEYCHSFPDDMQGTFDDDYERESYMDVMARELDTHLASR